MGLGKQKDGLLARMTGPGAPVAAWVIARGLLPPVLCPGSGIRSNSPA